MVQRGSGSGLKVLGSVTTSSTSGRHGHPHSLAYSVSPWQCAWVTHQMTPLGDLWTDVRLLQVGHEVVDRELQSKQHPLACILMEAPFGQRRHGRCTQRLQALHVTTCWHTSAAYRLTTPFHHSGHCTHRNSRIVTYPGGLSPEVGCLRQDSHPKVLAGGPPPTDVHQRRSSSCSIVRMPLICSAR
jgi:hypothetical protein